MGAPKLTMLALVATVVTGACSKSYTTTDSGPRRTDDAGADAGTAVAADGGLDAERFCVDRGTWRCARRRYAADACPGGMPFSMADYDMCIVGLPATCAGARFDPTCMPSQPALDACIVTLMDGANVCIPESSISECNFCPGR